MKIVAFAVVLACALSGCASGYTKFYKQADGATPQAIAAIRAGQAPSMPVLDHWGGGPKEAYDAYGKHGYISIGYSSFNGAGGVKDGQALEQAKKVGADLVVVIDPRYTGTRSSVIPVVTPTTNTSVTNGTATAYGTAGVATAYGSSTTTSYGTRTTFVPMSTDRFDYGAIYFVKMKVVFGAKVRPLSDQERQQLGTNKGAVIVAVIDNSPAFNADVLPGDVVESINGERMTADLFSKRINELKGQTVNVVIRRGDGTLDKSIALNN